MDNVTRYAAINTKIRSLEGRLLKDEDYINLLSKKNISEVVAYLKQNTHYGESLQSIDAGDVGRILLETCIKRSQVKGLEELSHFFLDGYREFYRTLFMRYEIEDLKSILRGIKASEGHVKDKTLLTRIGLFSKVNIDSLLMARDIREFINNLKGTIYYSYLHHLTQGSEDINLFSVEMNFDHAYYDMFYKSLGLINKEDRKIMENIQGIIVDLLNIQTIYRGLKFYNLPPEELFNYTIYYGKEFSRNTLKELCYVKTLEEFQKKILNTRYSFLFDHDNNRDIFMERRILRYEYFTLKSIKRKSGLDISQVIAYTLLIEMEVRDIISIIENVRYGMPVEDAKKFLIRKL